MRHVFASFRYLRAEDICDTFPYSINVHVCILPICLLDYLFFSLFVSGNSDGLVFYVCACVAYGRPQTFFRGAQNMFLGGGGI